MKTLSDMAGGSGGKPPGSGTTTPTVNVATSEQIHTLLNAATVMTAFLINATEHVDRNATDSASATFINITNRLDQILSETHRWNVAQYDDVVTSLKNMYDKQAVYMESAGKLADVDRKHRTVLLAPHNRPTVEFSVLNSGDFLVHDGDPLDPAKIKAIGSTPEEAARRFDLIWSGEEPYEPFAIRRAESIEDSSGQVGGGMPPKK